MRLRLPASRRLFRLPAGWPRWRLRPFGTRRRARTSIASLLFVVLALVWWRCSGDERQSWPHDQILGAIRWVESHDRDDVPDGDGGLAIGPYQIHEVYWRDAHDHDPSLGGSYQDCRRRDYSERVITAYMRHHDLRAWQRGDGETIARMHNGGPAGARKQATLGYWRRVRARLP